MPAIFRTDSGIFGDIQASNMIVTGEIKVGTEDLTINQYISSQVNEAVGDGIDYTVEINSLSGQISGVSGYATGLSGIVYDATGHIDHLSGVVSGILENPTSSEGVSNDAFSGLSGYATGLSGIVHDATGHIDHLSGVVSGILSGDNKDDSAFSGLSGYATGLSGIVHDATGHIDQLSGQITGITGDIDEISGFLRELDTSAHYSDSDVATYLGGNLNSDIIPSINSTYDIGSAEKKIRHLYLSNNSLYMGGEGTDPGTQISSTPQGAIVFPSGINISGAIGGVIPDAENNSIQWNTGTKQWESSDTLHTATGDLYSFYKRDNDTISNVSGSFDALNFKPTDIPSTKTSAGSKGQITYDENYVYMCVADNVWKRLPSADF